MSKYIQVNAALTAIEQGRFQILCNDFLKNEYSGDLQSLGTVEGKEKTRTGQPDAYIRKPDGQYILAEYTTKDDNAKTAFEKKLSDDLNECLKFGSLGIKPHQVDQIVLCCNSVVDIAFTEKLNGLVAPLGIKLRVIGIETLSTYYSSSGKVFARDFLHIDFDTGQILDKGGFIERYGRKDLATPLTNDLLGREQELKDLHSSLNERAITLLVGGGGTGKTRLALEGMDKFIEANPQYRPYYIFGKSGDIVEDLLTFLTPGRPYVLLIDDANRQVDNLLSVLDRLLDNASDIKILITVRDYAKNDVLKHLRGLDFKILPIYRLNDDIIMQIIAGQPFCIMDRSIRDRISAIAEGNPRLAIMAAKTYQKDPRPQSIADVSVIYDSYFQSVMDDGYLKQNDISVKVLGILSFFNNIDIRSELDLPILTTFGITSEEFYSTAEQLEDLEIVEIYDHSVVKITDQIFSTYMFYQAFIARELLDLRTLLEQYLENNQFRFKDTLFPVINVFGVEKVIGKNRSMLLEVFDELRANKGLAYLFLELFGFYFPEQSLVFVQQQINADPQNSEIATQLIWENERFSGKSLLLNLLGPFYLHDTEDFVTALVLGFRLVSKRSDQLENFLEQLKRALSAGAADVVADFPRLTKALNWLSHPSNTNEATRKAYFLLSAHSFLNTHYENKFYIETETGYRLHPNFAAKRGKLWEEIIADHETHHEVLNPIVKGYIDDEPHINHVLFNFDEPFIHRFITQNMRKERFADCYLAQRFLRFIEEKTGNLPVDYKALQRRYVNRTYTIFKLMSYDSYRKRYDYEVIEEARIANIAKKLPVRSLATFKTLYKHIAVIAEQADITRNTATDGLSIIFANTVDTGLEITVQCLKYYLGLEAPCWINPNRMFRKIFNQYPQAAEKLYGLISGSNFPYRQNWLEIFFYCLPESIVDTIWAERLLACYENVPSSNMGIYPEHFIRYENVRRDTITELLKIFYKKRETDNRFLYKLSHNIMSAAPMRVEANLKFYQDLYLQWEEVEGNADPFAEELFFLLTYDIGFFETYVSFLIEREDQMIHSDHKSLTRIWDFPDASTMVYNAILRISRMRFWSSLNHLSSIFFRQLPETSLAQAIGVLDRLLQDFPNDLRILNMILDITRNSIADEFFSFIKKILLVNSDIAIFKKLEFFNNHFSSNGNQIWADFKAATLSKVHAYIKAEMPDHYDYLEHLDFLTRRIAAFHENAEWERRLNFRGYR